MIKRVLFIVFALTVAGCKTVQPARVTQFSQAVNETHAQTQTAFTAINDLVTEDEIDRATKLDRLTEDDVTVVLKPEDIGKWDNAFGTIDKYCANLQTLVS